MDNILKKNTAALASKLIQFDTTTGVKPEHDCIMFIKDLLEEAGISTELIYKDISRPNLKAVIPAAKTARTVTAPPFVMYGQCDVVSVTGQKWSVDPFAGEIKDGYLWGRGAIDMKGQLAMFIQVMLRIAEEKPELPFDVCLLVVSDEEGNSDYGMKYLVENHPELFEDMKFAFGEIGGFSLKIAGKKLYPIQIAEKQVAEIKITARGAGGHASMSHKNTAMERLAGAVGKLSSQRLPVRITPPVKYMIESMAKALGGAQGLVVKQLLNPALTDKVLGLLGSAGNLFDPLLHNSLNVTIIGGGDAINVIPAEVWCRCDLRLVPLCSIEEAVEDIRKVIGEGFEIEVVRFDYGAKTVDMALFDGMARAIKEADPEACPVPFVLSAVTDARFIARAGVQSYGFTPMNLPEDYDFTDMAHNGDERVPEAALQFGTETIYKYMMKEYMR